MLVDQNIGMVALWKLNSIFMQINSSVMAAGHVSENDLLSGIILVLPSVATVVVVYVGLIGNYPVMLSKFCI